MALVLLVLAQAACLVALGATAWAAGWAVWGRRRPERLLHPLTACLGLAVLGELGLLLAALHLFRPAALVVITVLAHAAALPGWRLLLARAARAAQAARAARQTPGRAIAIALLGTAAAAGGFVIALFPPTAFDETTYHLSFARAFLATGGLPWVPELRVPTFPVLAEGLQAALLASWGERGTHQLALLATLLTAALLLVWGREAESPETGWLAAALFLGNPLVTYLAGTGYVDPLVGLFVAGSFYALWRARDDGHDGAWPWLAGGLAGAAAAVKYLGLYAVLVGGLALLLRRPPRWRGLLAFAGGAALTAAIPYGHLVWRTGNPLFPFFQGLFGLSRWEPSIPGAAPEYRSSILMLPFNSVFRRELAGEQPPLSPALLLGLALLAVAVFGQPRLRVPALVLAGFFPAFAVMPVVSRYLLTVLPLWCLLVALASTWAWRRLRGAGEPPGLPRSARLPRLAAAALSIGLALPGVAYGAFYLAQRGPIPTSPAAREAYLAEVHPGYRALEWLQRRRGPRYVALCIGCEHLHGFARGRLLGEHIGPWGYHRVRGKLGDAPALHRALRAAGAEYFLLPRTAAAGLRQPAARGRFELLSADADFELWRVLP